jgi:FixJ family two-component response regulator
VGKRKTALRSLRIAIVDDDESLCIALAGLLRSLGYAASGHGSAEDFLASGEVGHVDCIVSDVHMSSMSGLDLKKQLDAIGDHTPVIMITARTSACLNAQISALGAYGPLTKPFEADALLDCIQQAVAD